jgi:energy-converting hydrogenase B subunit Q
MNGHAALVTVTDQPGMLFGVTRVLAGHRANITYVDMHTGGEISDIYLEFTLPDDRPRGDVLGELRELAGVVRVEETPSLAKIYGKRIIVMGGGAQVGQVALGAIAEADRHNIRGEPSTRSLSSARWSLRRPSGPSCGCRACVCSCSRGR